MVTAKQMRETPKAKQAWVDYLALGPSRSLAQLAENYRQRAASSRHSVPTIKLRTLELWSATYGWQPRLQEIMDAEAKAAEEKEAVYRRSILETGLGLSYERVKLLKQLAEQLASELMTGHRLWVTEPRQIGSGKAAYQVDLERFNSPEVEQLRGLLDDIAREKSERVNASKVDLKADANVIVQWVPWAPRID